MGVQQNQNCWSLCCCCSTADRRVCTDVVVFIHPGGVFGVPPNTLLSPSFSWKIHRLPLSPCRASLLLVVFHHHRAWSKACRAWVAEQGVLQASLRSVYHRRHDWWNSLSPFFKTISMRSRGALLCDPGCELFRSQGGHLVVGLQYAWTRE